MNKTISDEELVEIKFEIGKYYKHNTGECLSILGEVKTTLYGECLVAESSECAYLKPVGKEKCHAVNYVEISHEEWKKNFS